VAFGPLDQLVENQRFNSICPDPNSKIAERLVLSIRTIDMVAAVLAKLGAHTRQEATTRAAAQDLSSKGICGTPSPRGLSEVDAITGNGDVDAC
jgi:hypothetical protein